MNFLAEEFKKYLAMILAVFCTAALSILFFFILFRMDALRSLIGKILNILMPFIYGTGIAYVLKQADLERAMDVLAKGIALYQKTVMKVKAVPVAE